MSISLAVFLLFVASTLGITYWAAKRSRGASAYFAAGRRITAWQNGFAVAGDFMSAASFLGLIGLIALQGFDGFLYSVGGFVAFVRSCWWLRNRCATPASTRWAMCWHTACARARCARWRPSVL